MGLGKTIAAKALDLLEDLRREFLAVAPARHALEQALAMGLQPAMALPGRHGATQLVGLAGGVVGRHYRDLHHLLLEQRHPQGTHQHLLQCWRGIGHWFLFIAPAQVRVDHAALDRPGADDGHLDHQVVELLRLEPGQHRHLRPRLDLEHADGIGPADHRVGRRVFAGNAGEAIALATVAMDQVETAADGAEHAQGEDVHLEQADHVQVVLVPLDHRALGHAGVLHRHQAVQGLLGNHEATGVLGQVSGKADQLPGQAQDPAQQRVLGVETGFAQAFEIRRAIAPAATAGGQGIDLVRRQAQGLGHVAHRPGAVIGADHRRQRRAMPAIAPEHVLQHLFAALVLEIDVDVRRFVALPGQEPLEQHHRTIRVDRGDAQDETHHRVGRRAAALAENVPLAGERDDVMHREEVALVAQLADHLQLVLDLRQHLGPGPGGPAPGNPLADQGPQPGTGVVALGHQLPRVLVAQLAEVEVAAFGDHQRLIEQRLGVQALQHRQRPQVALAIGEQALPGLGHRQVVADRGHGVLQGPAPPHMHVHIATGHRWQAQLPGQGQALLQPPGIVLAAMQFHRQPQPLGEHLAQPGRRIGVVLLIAFLIDQPQRQQPGQGLGEVLPQQAITPLLGPAPGPGDQSAQGLVTGQLLHQQHQARALCDLHFTADDQLQASLAGGLPSPHDTGQGAFVGDRQGLVAQGLAALEQLPGTGGATLEAEIGQAMQLGVAAHANQPCSNSGPASPTWR